MRQNVYPFEKPEFERIRMAAYRLLLNQRKPHIGMSARNIIIPGKKLVFDSLQNYSYETGISMYDLTANGKISLGCHVNFDDRFYLLLHNEDINSQSCLNWTDIHEIGHICLGHKENGDKEEVEAHFFASCFLMPDPVLRCLELKGCKVNKQLLIHHFGVSPEAAAKKIKTLNKGEFITSLDGTIERALYWDVREIIEAETDADYSFINFNALNLF